MLAYTSSTLYILLTNTPNFNINGQSNILRHILSLTFGIYLLILKLTSFAQVLFILVNWKVILQQQMIPTKRLRTMKVLSYRIRLKLISKLQRAQEQKYASYFLEGNQEHQLASDQQQVSKQSSEEEVAEEEEQNDNEFSVAEYVQMLSKEERQAFKQDNPQLPPLFFMTKKEKQKYFERVNTHFKKSLQRVPQRKSKTKKIIKFRNEFQIKPFSQKQKVTYVGHTKEIKESYQPKIHFS